jgi:hypothetical protein
MSILLSPSDLFWKNGNLKTYYGPFRFLFAPMGVVLNFFSMNFDGHSKFQQDLMPERYEKMNFRPSEEKKWSPCLCMIFGLFLIFKTAGKFLGCRYRITKLLSSELITTTPTSRIVFGNLLSPYWNLSKPVKNFQLILKYIFSKPL